MILRVKNWFVWDYIKIRQIRSAEGAGTCFCLGGYSRKSRLSCCGTLLSRQPSQPVLWSHKEAVLTVKRYQ